MKIRISMFSIRVVVLLIGISALAIVFGNNDTSESKAKEITKVQIDEKHPRMTLWIFEGKKFDDLKSGDL